jgi:hypothetical protein
MRYAAWTLVSLIILILLSAGVTYVSQEIRADFEYQETLVRMRTAGNIAADCVDLVCDELQRQAGRDVIISRGGGGEHPRGRLKSLQQWRIKATHVNWEDVHKSSMEMLAKLTLHGDYAVDEGVITIQVVAGTRGPEIAEMLQKCIEHHGIACVVDGVGEAGKAQVPQK